MTYDEIDLMFEDRNDAGAFHDVVLEAIDKSYGPSELKEIFLALPDSVKRIAKNWGLSDTPFKDEAYTWLQENKAAVCE